MGGWEETQAGSPKLTKSIFQTIRHPAQYIKWEEGGVRGGDVQSDDVCIPSHCCV